ncbi:acetamidase/formamidase family protein [Psychromarinibacter sp. C21-152]|uniref:Acetamidase/formamidase family protein n=2 Tax=Psychromarinibacter sediminicola TaxID=3033385 RepID=A0AAE3NY14_9RHOB|nr:acetamidase/formamidase family protein [Psychromarinibacter sediminicola]
MEPAMRIASGDIVVTETLDAAGTNARGERVADRPNPMNGPIHVAGAEPGDALRVDILRIDPARGTGWTRSALSANVLDPEYARNLPPRDRAEWIIDREASTVRLEAPEAALKHLVLPYTPMIGCFGVAPAGGEAISTATSGRNGGNMDYRGFAVGCSVRFPVAVPGALFFVGDCHAAQGDGEISGTGIETCCEVEIRLTVEKRRTIGWPRGELDGRIFTVGNACPLDQALQHATTEMVVWLKSEYGLSEPDTAHLLGQTVRYDVGNVFNPAYTMICSLEKKWLPERPKTA